ncbi:MAG: hypothetical protein OQK12_11365 [Motiliproteus sp.]|nr:hypothetical protein [Motiliproteus sp.]MCW9053709.1 hypothetical protein [Motiliproteus sp.]
MHIYRLITVLVIGSYLLSPLVIDHWESSSDSWYQPFVYWLLVILLTAWVVHRRGRDEF